MGLKIPTDIALCLDCGHALEAIEEEDSKEIHIQCSNDENHETLTAESIERVARWYVEWVEGDVESIETVLTEGV